jgi:hypothetical protein
LQEGFFDDHQADFGVASDVFAAVVEALQQFIKRHGNDP